MSKKTCCDWNTTHLADGGVALHHGAQELRIVQQALHDGAVHHLLHLLLHRLRVLRHAACAGHAAKHAALQQRHAKRDQQTWHAVKKHLVKCTCAVHCECGRALRQLLGQTSKPSRSLVRQAHHCAQVKLQTLRTRWSAILTIAPMSGMPAAVAPAAACKAPPDGCEADAGEADAAAELRMTGNLYGFVFTCCNVCEFRHRFNERHLSGTPLTDEFGMNVAPTWKRRRACLAPGAGRGPLRCLQQMRIAFVPFIKRADGNAGHASMLVVAACPCCGAPYSATVFSSLSICNSNMRHVTM